ncbi:reverse transcriptase [Tanacetum coccineum]
MVATRSTDTGGVLTNPNPSMESLVEMITRLANTVAVLENRINSGERSGQRREPACQNRGANRGSFGRLTKVEFSKFDGEDVQGWLYKVNKFFEMDHILDDERKIRLDSMHVSGKALNWHNHFMSRFGEVVTWEVYQLQVYQDSFEELLNKVKLNEPYAVSLFIGGLKEDIAYVVRMNNVVTNTFNKGEGNMVRTATTMPVQNNTTVPNKPFKRLTQQELEEKRAKHLCFYCDQKYMPGHKCNGQVFSLEVIGTDLDEDDELLLTEDGVVNTFYSLVDEQPLISLNALTGLNAYRTMRIKGCVGKNALHVLVDSWSTHNFLDLQVAKKLRCRLRKIYPLDVFVANGNVMSITYECKGFTWVFQGVTYTTNVMILPLEGCDMESHSEGYSTNYCPLDARKTKGVINTSIPKPIVEVLEAHEFVFDVPKEFPPKRSHDHTISLIPNTPLIGIKPYRHPPNQKDAVELMVKELLDSGVIRNSQSPFSSPIVMVKKKDGSWRMCIDYRQLNKHTVKDKFPILVIEELIDELSGAKVFLSWI